MSDSTRKLLNFLVDQGFSASIGKSSTRSSLLLRWGQKDDWKGGNTETNFPGLVSDKWFLFEIGRNYGDVFSVNVVDSVEIKDHHCIIHLKG